jgi:uncharacterized membrane protein
MNLLTAKQWLFVIFLVALLLRLSNLGQKSLWLDEGFSAYQAVSPATAVLTNVDNSHPPLYYVLLHYWVGRFGPGEVSIRLPSVLISLANLVLLYLLARFLLNEEVALAATALLALSPLDIWYAQEARMYLFITFAGLLMATGLAWQHEFGALLVVAGLAFGLYIDYLVAPLWIIISAVWLVLWWQRGHPILYLFLWLVASLSGWLLYRPWWPTFELFINQVGASRFVLEELRTALGLPAFTTTHLLVALAAGAITLLVGAIFLQKLARQPHYRRWLGWLVLALFVSLTLLAPLPRFYSVKRLLIIVWPYLLLLVAWFITRPEANARLRQGLLALCLVISLFTLYFVPKDEWRGAAAYLDERASEGIVWLDPDWNRFVYQYYRPDDLNQPPRLTLQETAASVGDIWLVAERFPGNPIPSSPSEAWLDEHWQLVESVPFYRLELRHYRP